MTEAFVWDELATGYPKVDPLAVLPVHAQLARAQLTEANAATYRRAARRLARMRRLATGSEKAAEVDQLIAELREAHRRRSRLQKEFDRARLS